MVRIRLRRTGKKKQASFRVVVADSESPRDGRFIENIGVYNPRTDPPTIQINEERARYWLSVGAQPSDPVAWLLRKVGVLEGGEPTQAIEEAAVEADADAEEVVAEADEEAAVEAEQEEAEVEEDAEDEAEELT